MRIGDYLKQKREQAKISLDAISHKTKINHRSLTALETNNFGELPSKVYVSAYVKNYCKSINIDDQEALKLLAEEYQEEVQEEAVALAASQEAKETNPIIGLLIEKITDKKVILATIVLIVSVSLIIKVKDIVNKKLPETPKAQEAKVNEVEDIKEEDKKELAKIIEEESDEKPPVLETKKEEKVQKEVKEETPVKEEKEEVKVVQEEPKKKEENNKKVDLSKYKKISRTMYFLKKDAAEISDPDIYPQEFKDQVQEGKQNVYITALFSDVWYRYKIDNKPVKQNTLKQGKRVLLKGDNVVMVFIGNFFATKVIYNNALVTGKAPAGVKSLIFPHDKRTDYYLPLFTKGPRGKTITSKDFVDLNSN